LAACGGQSASPGNFLPDADLFPGWAATGDVEQFDDESIFELVNGQADAFFVYGFEQVAVQDYENVDGVVIDVEVWQLATPADAYGLFTTSISGQAADVGNDGDADPGRRIAFWQERYFVHARARQEIDDVILRQFAGSISATLPPGGERPALVAQLPPDGLVQRSALFFHQEISIQHEIWLGGENLLGLGPETDGVLAHYDVGGTTARLMLIQFPDAESATAALAALESGQLNGRVDGLASANAHENLLGAVFGGVDAAAANELLDAALGNSD
jgi:hypothetical protein